MRRGLTAGAVMLAGLLPQTAAAGTLPVNIEFQGFSPTPLDVLPGETVEWTNVSERRHTVTADDDSFDSGDVFGGDHFDATFDAVGGHPYHCTVHPGMRGEVDVRRVTLGALPTELTPRGQSVEVDGRTADPSAPVTIERSSGSGFEAVATATPSADGSWRAAVVAEKTAEYRATVGSDVSQTRRLLVSDRRVIVRVRRGRVDVRVAPPAPYQRITLELRLRERFGWWPEQQRRLDYLSRVTFRIDRRVRARVALVDRDGWTALARSPVVRLRPARR
jgi:plastocyanin